VVRFFYFLLKPMVRRYKVRRAKLREKRSTEIKARRQAEAEARAATSSPTGPSNDPRGWQ
jgi:hypothetical protein